MQTVAAGGQTCWLLCPHCVQSQDLLFLTVCLCCVAAPPVLLPLLCLQGYALEKRLLEFMCSRYFYVDSLDTFLPVPDVPKGFTGQLRSSATALTAAQDPR